MTVGGSGSGQARRTRQSIAWFDDPTSRPTISISPSRRTSSVRAGSIIPNRDPADPPASVDVVTVAARADVALRIERLAAQRARQPARGDDRQRAVHEPARLGGREADAKRVGSLVVILVHALERRQQLARRRAGEPLDR